MKKVFTLVVLPAVVTAVIVLYLSFHYEDMKSKSDKCISSTVSQYSEAVRKSNYSEFIALHENRGRDIAIYAAYEICMRQD